MRWRKPRAATGLRARRVILDGRWWEAAGLPMLARVAERRGAARASDAAADARAPAGTGWVALIPHPVSGYRMYAADPTRTTVASGRSTRRIAPRASPRSRSRSTARFDAARARRRATSCASRWRHNRADASTVLATGLAAALIGLLTPIGDRLPDRPRDSRGASLARGTGDRGAGRRRAWR